MLEDRLLSRYCINKKAINNIYNTCDNQVFKKQFQQILLEAVDPHNPKIPPQTIQAIKEQIESRGNAPELQDILAFYNQNKQKIIMSFKIEKFKQDSTKNNTIFAGTFTDHSTQTNQQKRSR